MGTCSQQSDSPEQFLAYLKAEIKNIITQCETVNKFKSELTFLVNQIESNLQTYFNVHGKAVRYVPEGITECNESYKKSCLIGKQDGVSGDSISTTFIDKKVLESHNDVHKDMDSADSVQDADNEGSFNDTCREIMDENERPVTEELECQNNMNDGVEKDIKLDPDTKKKKDSFLRDTHLRKRRTSKRIQNGRFKEKTSAFIEREKKTNVQNAEIQVVEKEPEFQCNWCSKTFPRKRKLKEHMSIHTGEKPFKCSGCDKSYTRKDSLARHESEHHSGVKTEAVEENVCQNCFQKFDTLEELKKHSDVHASGKPFQCEFCYKYFSAKDKLRYHIVQAEHIKYTVTESGEIETEVGDEDMKWYIKRFIYCSPCDIYFKSPNLRRRHVSKCHYKGPHQTSAQTQFKCNICNLCLANKYTLQKHMWRIHNNDEDSGAKNRTAGKPLDCSEDLLSQQSFEGSANIIGNSMFESGYYNDVQNHSEIMENSFISCSTAVHVSADENSPSRITKPGDLVRYCSDIDVLDSKPNQGLNDDLPLTSFSNVENTQDVAHFVINKEVRKDASTVSQLFERRHSKIFRCKFCPKVFKKQWLLQSHERVHTKPYLCDLCAKPFSNKDILSRHIKLFHLSSDKLLNCDYCGKRFVTEVSLKRHVSGHTGEGLYKCDICGRGFALKSDLKKHQTIHLETKDFVCEICGKAFKAKDNLRSHLLSHVDEKIRCDVCGKIFKNRYTFSRHMNRHSGKTVMCSVCGKSFKNSSEVKQHMFSHTGERPCKCTYCPKAFSSKGKLRVHERIHTGVKPYKCNVCGKSSADVANHIKHMKIHDQVSKKKLLE